MPTCRWVIPPLLLLATAGTVFGNVAVPVFKEDPGYGRARFAASVAGYAVLAALIGAIYWWATTPSRVSRIAAVVFGVGVFFCGALHLLTPATEFPDDANARERPRVYFRKPGSPRPTTADETALAGVFALVGLAVGGLALVRLVTRRDPPAPDGPTSTSVPSA